MKPFEHSVHLSLHTIESRTFAPKRRTGWADAGKLVGQHTSVLFDNAQILGALKRLLGGRYQPLSERLEVAGNMEDAGGNLIVASGCMPHACDSDRGFVGLDAGKRLVYVALQKDGNAVRLYPAAGKWPRALRDRVKAWEARK